LVGTNVSTVQINATLANLSSINTSQVKLNGYYNWQASTISDYIFTPSLSSFNTASDFTMECFYYPTSNIAWGTIMSLGITTVSGREFRIGQSIESGGFGMLWPIGSNVDGTYFSGTRLPLSNWNHVALVRSTNQALLFANGDLLANSNISYSTIENHTLWLFRSPYVNQATGYINSARIVMGQALYKGNFTPPTQQLTISTVGTSGPNVASSLISSVTFLGATTSNFIDTGPLGITVNRSGNPSTNQISHVFTNNGFNVGLNCNTPSYLLDVNGRFHADSMFTNSITGISTLQLNATTVIAQDDAVIAGDTFNYTTYATSPIDYTNIVSCFTIFDPGFYCTNAFLSGNGQHHVLFGMSSLWRSSNYGSSWTNILSTNVSTLQFQGGAASATGKYMTATTVDYSTLTSNYIYTSKDCGATWAIGSVLRTWIRNPAMSASGQYQIACTTNDYPWISSDYGTTWTAVTSISFNVLWCCAISASGQYQALTWYGGNIFVSSDYGVTWTQRTSLFNYLFTSLVMSGNGKYIIAVPQNQLYIGVISSDYGVTWTNLSVGFSGGISAISYTGQYIFGSTGRFMFMSQDYGNTFVLTNATQINPGPQHTIAINYTSQYIYEFASFIGGIVPHRGFLPILAPGGITGNMNVGPYRLLVNGSTSNLSVSDNGKTFLFSVTNSQSATLLLPSTTLISPGWTCKIVNMNTSGTGSNANLYVSSSQSLIYGQAPSGRSTFAHINVNGTTTVTNTYTKYVNIVYDGSNYYAIP
jgi:hypothetical protein